MPDCPFDVVAAVNDPGILARNLGASPVITSGAAALHVEYDAPCTGVAYNRGLDATGAEIVVFAHQDAYLPASWPQRLEKAVAAVERENPNWAVFGPVGVTVAGEIAGRIWCAGNGGLLGGKPADSPVPVQSLDEVVLVLRRASGLRFDASLPSFHLYGADIVQQARTAGLGAYAIGLPVVHNSKPVATLAGGYAAAWRYLRRKWRDQLPIVTTVSRIDASGLKFLRDQFWVWRSRKARAQSAHSRDEHPAIIAKQYNME